MLNDFSEENTGEFDALSVRSKLSQSKAGSMVSRSAKSILGY